MNQEKIERLRTAMSDKEIADKVNKKILEKRRLESFYDECVERGICPECEQESITSSKNTYPDLSVIYSCLNHKCNHSRRVFYNF